MGYTAPLAFLLGLEGVALLRACAGDDFDGPFVAGRIAEIQQLVSGTGEAILAGGTELGLADTRTGYAKWAETYDSEDNPLLRVEEPVMRQALADLPAGCALDAACGTGRHTAWLAALGHQVVGVDSSSAMVARAIPKTPEARFLLGDLHQLPVPDATFDLVICALALTHQPSLFPVFAEFARVVRPGGHVVTSDIHVASVYLGGVAHVPDPSGPPRAMPASRFLANDYISAALGARLEVRGCAEPRWGAMDGHGGPWAQALCPAAAAAAYQDTPAAIIWHFQRTR